MQPTLMPCVNQLGDSEAHHNNFPGDYEYEWLGFQAFGPLDQLGCFLPYSSRRQQHLRIKGVIQFTPPPELVLGHWGEGGSLLSRVEDLTPPWVTNSGG